MFGGSNPLIDKNDNRLCQIPFGTKKATFGEVQKVRNQLSTVLVYGNHWNNILNFIFILWHIFFPTDSKEIINNYIQNYFFKLFKKRKSNECNVNRTKKPVDIPIENNKTVIEKVQSSLESGNISFFQLIKPY